MLFLIPADADEINKEYQILLGELEKFNKELLYKDRLVAISKSDMLYDELKSELEATLDLDAPHVFISSVTQDNLDVLKDRLLEIISA